MAGIDENTIWTGAIVGKDYKPGDLVAYVARAPGLKKTKDTVESNRHGRCRACMQKVIDYMIRKPGATVDIWTSLESKLIVRDTPTESALADRSDHIGKPTFGKLPTLTKAMVLCSLENGPTNELLDRVNDVDPHAISDFFQMGFQVAPTDKFPSEAQSKVVLVQLMRKRNLDAGSRLATCLSKSVSLDGHVDWMAAPLFKLSWQGGVFTKVAHVSGDEAVP